MSQFGVRNDQGNIITDAHWTSMSAVLYGFHGFGFESASDLGELVVQLPDGSWKDVINNESDR